LSLKNLEPVTSNQINNNENTQKSIIHHNTLHISGNHSPGQISGKYLRKPLCPATWSRAGRCVLDRWFLEGTVRYCEEQYLTVYVGPLPRCRDHTCLSQF